MLSRSDGPAIIRQMSFLRIENLHKVFGRVVAVERMNLEIAEGEIHLGERCLASGGRKLFVKPEKRDMGMVFQSYALWPHMTVFENVVYPLTLRGIKGREAAKKVAD